MRSMMSGPTVKFYPTHGFHGYSVKFSPFSPTLIAVAAGQNFGITGTGQLIVIDLNAPGDGIVCRSPWGDGLYDLAWSESEQTHIVTASGDGSIQLWDSTNPENPVLVFHEHKKEVSSIEWSLTRSMQCFVSASWDCLLKLWDPGRSESVLTFSGHHGLVYQTSWSPHLPGCIASVSGDGTLKVWNSSKGSEASLTIHTHEAEVLSCDWSRYDQNIIATGATDGLLKGWDLRHFKQPLFVLQGHDNAIRRVKFSPFDATQLASTSYDFTTRVWDHSLTQPSLHTFRSHTEFVYGLDFCTHRRGLFADCAWDQKVATYQLSLSEV